MKDRVLRISRSDLEVSDEKVKSLMNDMVNARTPGYQKSEVVTRSFPLELQSAINRINSGKSSGALEPKIEGTFYSRIKGSLVKTGGKLDAALGGDGYFTFYGPMGEIYSRDGRFVLDHEGNLVSAAGNFKVLGEGGPISLSATDALFISPDGDILIDGEKVAKLRVVKIENPSALKAVTGSFYGGRAASLGLSDDENPRIVQGYVETSNVSVIDQMMDLIYLSQKVNLASKVVKTRDGDLGAALQMGNPNQ